MHEVYPFRLFTRRGGIVPQFPGECEPQCAASDELRDHLGYGGFSEYLEYMRRTRDERQCRGCGRWGIWERRAITSNLPDGTIILGPGKAFVASANGQWQQFAEVLPSVQRPARACPCCNPNIAAALNMSPDDCCCRTACDSPRCQMREAGDHP